MPTNFQQLPWIAKMLADEAWYLGERRGCYVSPSDPAVTDRVVTLILSGVGEMFRHRVNQPTA